MPRAQRTQSAGHEALQRRVRERPGDSFSGLLAGGDDACRRLHAIVPDALKKQPRCGNKYAMLMQPELLLRRSAQHAPLAARAARRSRRRRHACAHAKTELRPTKCVSRNLKCSISLLASGGLPPPHLRLLKSVMLKIAAAHSGVNLRTG